MMMMMMMFNLHLTRIRRKKKYLGHSSIRRNDHESNSDFLGSGEKYGLQAPEVKKFKVSNFRK